MRDCHLLRRALAAVLLAVVCLAYSTRAVAQPVTEPLPGLVPSPRALPGIGRWQLAHKIPRGRIYSLAWSPDGKKLAYSEMNYVRICDAKTFDLERVLVGHSSRVTSIDWNRATNRIASASYDGSVRIWSADGVPQKILRGHTQEATGVAWAKDGSQLASASKDGTARIWSVAGDLKHILQVSAGVNCVAWSPDGSRLVTGDDNNQLKIWSADGRLRHVCVGHLDRVTAVAMSPDGTRIGSATIGFTDPAGEDFADARLWNSDGACTGSFLSSGRLFGLRWTSDGKEIVIVNHQGRLQFLGPNAEIRGDQSVPISGRVAEPPLGCSPDGNEIAVGGTGAIAVVKIGDSETDRILHQNRGSANFRRVQVSAMNGNRDRLILRFPRQNEGPKLWSLASGHRWNAPIDIEGNSLSNQSFSSKGDRIVFVAGEKQLSRWDPEKDKIDLITKLDRPIVEAAWNPVNDRIACCDDQGTIRVVTDGGAKLLEWHPRSAPQAPVNSDQGAASRPGAASSRLRWVANGQAVAVSEETRVEVRRLEGTDAVAFEFGSPFHQFWISPDLRRAAAWVTDKKDSALKVCFADGSPTRKIADFNGKVSCYACNRDLSRFVVGGSDGTWEMRQLDDFAADPQEVLAHPHETVSTVAFSPDGKRFATGGWDALVKIWRSDGTAERTLAENNLPIARLWWSRDSKRLVSLATSGTFMRWSVGDGQLESLTLFTESGKPLQIPRDGRISAADAKLAAEEFFALIERPNGTMEIVAYPEFLKRTGQAVP
jgi:WD40 repeat protein